jgi:DMSO/TMAO reductase YedYZ molybdopterin-dependent catalytic subunit
MLGVSELASGIFNTVPSLLVSVADRIIDWAPGPVVRIAIQVFGSNDKAALVELIMVVVLIVGAAAGSATRRSASIGPVVLALLGLAGVLAAIGEPGASLPLVAVTTLIAVGIGILTLRGLVSFAGRSSAADAEEDPRSRLRSRREFFGVLGGVAIVAVGAGVGGRALLNQMAAYARALVRLPKPGQPAPPLPAGASLPVAGITPIVSTNDTFYRIDTAIDTPMVDPTTWSLHITGMVQRSIEISFADLLAMPMVEDYVTLTCVSNLVGGNLTGNARWLGVPIKDLLTRAGVQSGATQIVGRSLDGFTVGIPTEAVLDGRVALVAVGMNGAPLPYEHGFPARLVVSGLYGYVSATKWLSELELTTFEAFDAFWVERGWAQQGPIKTESRIDVPQNGRSLRAGMVPVAGVAWAQTRGISRVQVRIDDQPWQDAMLAQAIGINCWRQWVLYWNANPGSHTLAVRATDGNNITQTSTDQDPPPDGATGYHTIVVEVNG